MRIKFLIWRRKAQWKLFGKISVEKMLPGQSGYFEPWGVFYDWDNRCWGVMPTFKVYAKPSRYRVVKVSYEGVNYRISLSEEDRKRIRHRVVEAASLGTWEKPASCYLPPQTYSAAIYMDVT